MKTLAITGTPGIGKSALARELSLLLHMHVLDVTSFIKEHRISESFDRKRRCYVVDSKKLNKALIRAINTFKTQNKGSKGLIIDSHMSHILPRKYVDLCIVTKCDLKILRQRLTSKGYSSAKVRENLDAEIFDICLMEAMRKKHKIMVVDTTKNSAKKIAKIIFPKIP